MLPCTEIARSLASACDPIRFHQRHLTKELPALDAWQEDGLLVEAPNLLLLCGRQTGKSTLAGILAAWTAIEWSSRLVLLISPTQRQSSELFRKTRVLVDAVSDRPEIIRRTSTQLELANGSSVVSLPGANPDAIRGYSKPALIIEDESAFVSDATFKASRPMLATSTYGRHVLLSTPYGRRGHFYELWSGDDPNWRRLMIKSADCPRISSDFLAGEERVLGNRSYRQEYECEFLEAATAVFPSDVVERLVDDERRRDVLPDEELSKRIKTADTAEKAVDLMKETGLMKDGQVSLDGLGGGAPFPAFSDDQGKDAVDPEAKAAFCRANNELAKLRDERRPMVDREAKIADLERRIEELRGPAGMSAEEEDEDDGEHPDRTEDDGPVEVDPSRWGAL